MSDPVTNVEIEDVLSSIRRLVSEGEKLRDASAPAQPRGAAPSASDGPLELAREDRADYAPEAKGSPVRFVLTSAYRVDSDQAEIVAPGDTGDRPDETGQEESPVPMEETVVEEATRPEEPSPSVDTPASADIVWTEDDTASGAPAGEGGAAIPDWVIRGQAELDALEAGADRPETSDAHAEHVPSDQDARPGDTPAPQDRVTLESTIAELEAAISDTGDDWEPDGSEDTPVMDWDNAMGAELLFSSRFTSGGPVEEAQVAADDDMEPDAIAEKFDAAEALYSDADIEAPEDPLNEHLTAYLEQDDVLDEETLRQMVAEIVRQELQGPLGERITRNVRKLVRREIYRALAEQGFD